MTATLARHALPISGPGVRAGVQQGLLGSVLGLLVARARQGRQELVGLAVVRVAQQVAGGPREHRSGLLPGRLGRARAELLRSRPLGRRDRLRVVDSNRGRVRRAAALPLAIRGQLCELLERHRDQLLGEPGHGGVGGVRGRRKGTGLARRRTQELTSLCQLRRLWHHGGFRPARGSRRARSHAGLGQPLWCRHCRRLPVPRRSLWPL
mmetsp:Transcript_3455/g.9145  ORF Transcript_3455/g.9145 Transcript_3455/m.9145 type:complete len:208 (+) Transcript_3455:197-820(+)